MATVHSARAVREKLLVPAIAGRNRVRPSIAYFAAMAGENAKNLPYGLDIWVSGKGKVLNIEWSDNGPVHLVSFRRGVWEEDISKVCDQINVA